MNRVNLIGRVTRDFELRHTDNDVAYVKFTVAINGGYNDKTDYINVIAWRKNAENSAKFLKRGSLVGIDGKIDTSTYVDGQGVNRRSFNIFADRVFFLSPKDVRTREPENAKEELPTMSEALGVPEIDDLPWR